MGVMNTQIAEDEGTGNEVLNGIENEENKTHDENGLEQADGKDQNNEGADRNAGEGDLQNEEKGETGIDPREKEILELKTKYEALEKKISAPEYKEPPQLTEDQKQLIAQNAGVENYRTVEFFNNQIAGALMSLKNYVDNKFSDTNGDKIISALAAKPGFKDAEMHKDKINGFLSKFNPEMRANPEVVEMGYWYAKGQGTSKAVKQAVNSNEINRRVVSKVKINSPSKAAPTNNMKLNDLQRQAGKLGGMNDQEYARNKKQGGKWNIA